MKIKILFFTVFAIFLTAGLSSGADEDPYRNYSSWRRFKTAEFMLSGDCWRFSFFEISTGGLNHKLGRGFGLVEVNKFYENDGFYKETLVISVLPLFLYTAFPLGKTPQKLDETTGEGSIVIVPKQGFFQYPACFYMNLKLGLFSLAGFEKNKEYAVSYCLSFSLEKSLWYQNFIALEAGYNGYFCCVDDKNNGTYYIGLSSGVLSNWKRVDI
ncbi:hypothetical protein JW890_01585 [candidate division WOR-3 bacterium]|nr:hypothetical protein [candidate division WOR-3 bacterium]